MKEFFDVSENRKNLYNILKGWVGTPYKHMGTTKNRAIDCSKFIGLVLVEMGVLEKIDELVFYSKDWHIHGQKEIMIEEIDKHLEKYLREDLFVYKKEYNGKIKLWYGDLLCYSICKSNKVNHSSFFLGRNKQIHAASRSGIVISTVPFAWYKRLKYVYRLYYK